MRVPTIAGTVVAGSRVSTRFALLGIHMNDAAVQHGYLVEEFVLDLIRDLMAFGDGKLSVHAHGELTQQQVSRPPRTGMVYVANAVHGVCYVLELLHNLRVHPVKQAPEHQGTGLAEEHNQDEAGDHQAYDWIGYGEPQGDPHSTEHDGQRGQPVGACVVPVCYKRGAPDAPPGPDAELGDRLVAQKANGTGCRDPSSVDASA